ncbi:hypothetical protein [Actinoplanes utahensis]|uniref:PBS lyase n=1 Tax=Actinoplanes utahensis TaxID=1869 RepID=A0A0A6UU88_ACTUT|nr:hypothetical protein [Actinoplanes utahensis]KHD78029.1 hypothetical protein MB27_07980 [Actinoplanes utahensis]
MIDWAALTHADGTAEDLPDLLRAADLDTITELIFPQGTLYPATVAAVPFLAEIVRTGPAARDEAAWLLGMIADPRHAYGVLREQARAALAAERLPLGDPDPAVRTAVAYATAQAGGPVAVLGDRFAIEDHPGVRASLHLALGHLDPVQASARFPFDGPAEERYAAGLALARAGTVLPAGAAIAITAAVDEGPELHYAWAPREPVEELVLPIPMSRLLGDERDALVPATAAPAVVPSPVAASTAGRSAVGASAAAEPPVVALVTALAASPVADTRRAAVFAVAERSRCDRSAPKILVPLVAALLDDPDPGVRDEVISTLRDCGPIAGRYRERIAAIAAHYPAPVPPGATPGRSGAAGRTAITSELRAVETLRWLGDPRWVELDPEPRHWDPRWIPYTPEALEAVRRRLPSHHHLADLIASWGPRAAAAVPDLIALLPETGFIAAAALARLGHAAPEALPHLWRLAHDGDIDAAAAVRRLTGDPRLLLSALVKTFRSEDGRRPGSGLAAILAASREPLVRPTTTVRPPLLDPGPDLLPAVPVARAHLTGECSRSQADRQLQILAAVVVTAATGDSTPVLPTLRALLVPRFPAVADAAELLADLAGPERPLLQRLDELLNGDRIIRSGSASDLIWVDESIRSRLEAVRQTVRR